METEGTEKIVESQGGLELDADVLQKDDNISTSLCDRFGIHMYTEEFLEKEEAYQDSQEQKMNEIFADVMHNPKTENKEYAFQVVMRADTDEVIKAEYNGNQEAVHPYAGFAYGVFGALLAGVILFFIERYRRKRNENHYNN